MKRFSYVVIIVLLLAGCSSEQTSKSLSAEEQLALQYVEQFLNNKDVEVKKKFVEEHVHPDVKQIFSLAANAISGDSAILSDTTVIGSVDYEKAGKKGKTVLVRGKNNKGEEVELIFLIMDGKFGWGSSEASNKKVFQELRAKFK
ncbi:hypothetical protein [Brevibacillus laterosporus]|uniref:hypothetical protein n=1 Tax=Brevibacillus laterosporus TaxID=1465 RepID=UPI0026542C6A|nr:hypothetical protein [Brevibacillus laterosporus]MDN9010004.1 hypothetical protein [Brevibacillus laterosporus]MDO0940614.1 hypothetical protein [Brevibacillus laterosporus]